MPARLTYPLDRLIYACVALCVLCGLVFAATDFDRLQKSFSQRWGAAPQPRFTAWRTTLAELPSAAEPDKLKRVNEFFNRQISFQDDQTVWSAPDYWATPLEFMGKGAGDCEDYAIAKYFSLSMLGVPNERLRLTYVKAKIGGTASTVTQAHMILAYYAQPDAEPLILDNLLSDIRPASRRTDLIPVFSFNSDGLWVGNAAQSQSPVDKLSRWKELLLKMREEGFEL